MESAILKSCPQPFITCFLQHSDRLNQVWPTRGPDVNTVFIRVKLQKVNGYHTQGGMRVRKRWDDVDVRPIAHVHDAAHCGNTVRDVAHGL